MNGVPRSAALAAAALLAGGLLAACGGGDDGAAAQPTPSFSSSTASPTASSAPSSRSPMQSETPAQFVVRWNNALTKMQNSGDSTTFRTLNAQCEACTKVANLVDQYYGAGGFVRTRGWKITSTDCKAVTSLRYECVSKIHGFPTRYRESASGPLKRFPVGDFSEFFRVSKHNGDWVMTYIAEEAT